MTGPLGADHCKPTGSLSVWMGRVAKTGRRKASASASANKDALDLAGQGHLTDTEKDEGSDAPDDKALGTQGRARPSNGEVGKKDGVLLGAPRSSNGSTLKSQRAPKKRVSIGSEPATKVDKQRQRLIRERQQTLEDIVERHDGAVRELFHLDKFTNLLDYDPDIAKEDDSEVFHDFKKQYDLFTHAVTSPTKRGQPGMRTTRNALNARRDMLAGSSTSVLSAPAVSRADTKGKVKAAPAENLNAKGKGKEAPAENLEKPPSRAKRKERIEAVPAKEDIVSDEDIIVEAPPPVSRRAKMAKSLTKEATSVPAVIIEPPELSLKPRPKRARRKSDTSIDLAEHIKHADEGSSGEEDDKPTPPPVKPVKLPKSAVPAKRKVPPFRPLLTPMMIKRRKEDVPDAPKPTHPLQMLDDPEYGDLLLYLDSFTTLNGTNEPKKNLTKRIKHEAWLLERIDHLKSEGRLNSANPDRKVVGDSMRKSDHTDSLVEQAIQAGNAYKEGRKARAASGKRIVKGVAEYAEVLAGAEDRRAAEIQRNLKALAKWTAKEVRKKWQMAVDVIRAKADAEELEEQQRLGKMQLEEILEKSEAMLATRRTHMVVDEDSEDDDSLSSTPETVVDTEPASSDDDGSRDEHSRQSDENALVDNRSDSPQPISSDLATKVEIAKSEAPFDGQSEVSHNLLEVRQEDTAASLQNGSTVAKLVDGDGVPSSAAGELSMANGADAEYASENDDAREADDANFEDDMHIEEGSDRDNSDEEMNDLAIEADLPLEQLLAKYKYRTSPSTSENDVESGQSEGNSPTEATLDTENTAGQSATMVDEEFASLSDEDRDAEDAEMEADMDADPSEASSAAELDGLAADADIPIEELLGAYRPGEDPTPEPSEADNHSSENVEVAESRLGTTSIASPVAEGEEASEDEVDGGSESVSDSPQTIRVTVPFLLRGNLRPYQKGGLDWLASLYMSGLNGILADEMGLGKTIQTIALLGWLACEQGVWGPHLIVVPTSVMLNWEMEFKKFLPGFKILTYYGNTKERKEKRKGWSAPNSFHVCITSYQICLADQHMFRRKSWLYMILDEAHHIKNFRSQRWQTLLGFNTQRRLLLTGTPLQNNLMELWSLLYCAISASLERSADEIFKVLMPAHLNGHTGPFANHKDFLDWFSNPMEKAIESGEALDDETRATVHRLHTILRPYLLRRLKADVETQMPAKYEHIVYCRLSKRQRYLYDDFMSRAKTRETLASGNFMGVINCLMQLRKVCNHPDLFEVRPISTSFAMLRPAAAVFGPTELIIRKRLLDEGPYGRANLQTLNLVRTANEGQSIFAMKELSVLDASKMLSALLPPSTEGEDLKLAETDLRTAEGWRTHLRARKRADMETRLQRMSEINTRRCSSEPYFGAELTTRLHQLFSHNKCKPSDFARDPRIGSDIPNLVPGLVKSYSQRADLMEDVLDRYAFATPPVVAKDLGHLALPGVTPEELIFATEPFLDEDAYLSMFDEDDLGPTEPLQLATTKLSIAFPDRSLLQYDCGKLQKLYELLSQLVVGGHRALIFTQMTKVLDILETFLSFHGWRYLRLDGSTKVEDRQRLTERFNRDPRVLCFISSTRAGGLGINLTGADTVVFYDTDWNPSMDRQCQDRAHRIGQTRDVHIYRFISEATIEENVLKKANQKRLLDDMVISDGEFTTEFFNRVDWRDMLGEQLGEQIGGGKQAAAAETGAATPQIATDEGDLRKAFANAEDEEDQAAAEAAQEEIFIDAPDFSEQAVVANQPDADEGGPVSEETPAPEAPVKSVEQSAEPEDDDEEKGINTIKIDEDLEGTIDGYLLQFADREWDDFLELDY